MNCYQFENKDADNAFLRGNPVSCPAVLKVSDFADIKEGQSLVIMLSSGKKYMGEIVKTEFEAKEGYISGHFEVMKKNR